MLFFNFSYYKSMKLSSHINKFKSRLSETKGLNCPTHTFYRWCGFHILLSLNSIVCFYSLYWIKHSYCMSWFELVSHTSNCSNAFYSVYFAASYISIGSNILTRIWVRVTIFTQASPCLIRRMNVRASVFLCWCFSR